MAPWSSSEPRAAWWGAREAGHEREGALSHYPAAGSVLADAAAPRKAASVTAHFAEKNAAAVGDAVTGIAVFADCEAVKAGAGSLPRSAPVRAGPVGRRPPAAQGRS